MKTTSNQIKMASDKNYTKKINRYFLDKLWDFFSMRLGNKSARNEQKQQKFIKTLLLLKKRNKFELIRNSTHQMKSLRESFIPQKRVTEAFNCPGYVIRIQKERQIQAKTKKLHENDVPPIN